LARQSGAILSQDAVFPQNFTAIKKIAILFSTQGVFNCGGQEDRIMGNRRAIVTDGVLLGREHWDVPLRVPLRSFLDFHREMEVQMRRLVTRWAHAASPRARAMADRTRLVAAFVPPIPK
jgi:hypothetical protein